MTTCVALRRAALAAPGGAAAAAAAAGRGLLQEKARRNFSMLGVVRGLSDGVQKIAEMEEWLRRRPWVSSIQNPPRRRQLHGSIPPLSRSRSHPRPQTTSRSASTKAQSTPASSSLSEHLRSVMRQVPHSVVVCTTSTPEGTPRAMTMSSFTSLTLSPPSPLISFNIASPSRTLDAMSASREFNIHIMVGDAKGAALADHFTRGNADEAELFGEEFGKLGANLSPVAGQEGPVLLGGDGVLYVLRCRVLDDEPSIGLVRVRDHVIVIGEVVEIVGSGGQEREELGLAYADRKYRRVGETI